MQDAKRLKDFLEEKAALYNRPAFIEDDPVAIPHLFSRRQDIEIMGLWAAVLAWGQRKTILNKCRELIQLMDGEPYAFIMGHEEKDLQRFLHFKHRTFNATDALYFIAYFRNYYQKNDSLEEAFSRHLQAGHPTTEKALAGFHRDFFSLQDYPARTRKHIATPERKSRCKRLNMFLRWMVRKDNNGVDLGIWNRISPSQLVCPLDLHVNRVARKLGLIERRQTDWLAALELTGNLKKLDPDDPVKYDFALFGLGILEKF